MATTRVGLLGPMTAYPGFSAKATGVVVLALVVTDLALVSAGVTGESLAQARVTAETGVGGPA